MTGLFAQFDQVRIINLMDRLDRRREMEGQLGRVGAGGPNVRFFDAHRPTTEGEFPSLGARGCFESHLAVLREARSSDVRSLLLLEDDFDFSRDGRTRAAELLEKLSALKWDFFYGAHALSTDDGNGLSSIAPDKPVLTASFLAFSGRVLSPLIEFLEGILQRPGGSPEYGPMHVDGAYTIFRQLHPEFITFAAFPPLGRQRSSPSDITPRSLIFDRWKSTHVAVALVRKCYNYWRRQ